MLSKNTAILLESSDGEQELLVKEEKILRSVVVSYP